MPTLEHRRFKEFCDACRRYAYIGLCFGAPGVGKTWSARSYSRCEQIEPWDLLGEEPVEGPTYDTVLYTPAVVNAPKGVGSDIRRHRDRLKDLAGRSLRREKDEVLKTISLRDEQHRMSLRETPDWQADPQLHPTYDEVARDFIAKQLRAADPTTLIVVDEADRLRMASLEQVRSIFDAGGIGLILIGMPGLEKRLARYPQFYSRIGFVHEFRPLGAVEIRQLMEQRWVPPGVQLPEQPLDVETVAAIIRVTGGNFRLLNRLLTQMDRILEINALGQVTKEVVEAARESLVIGQA